MSLTDDSSSDRPERQEFWLAVIRMLSSEAERVVVLRSFVLNQRPSEIYAQRPDLFASLDDVYSIKRNVLARLRRSE